MGDDQAGLDPGLIRDRRPTTSVAIEGTPQAIAFIKGLPTVGAIEVWQ